MTSSNDKYHTLPKASAKAFIDAAARQRLLLAASSTKLRDSSPRWKEHYDALEEKWGAIASGKVPNDALWDEIQEQKAKGQYPWTHLSHDQDAEVWIDPAALPSDMSRTTLRSKDASIPREWFHLPKGAEPPTVDDLLRDSSPDTPDGSSNQIKRAKSPPICGRSRSKSREGRPVLKFIQKKFVDDGGYEPVGGGAVKPLNQINLPVASLKNTNGFGLEKDSEQKKSFHNIPPREAVTALPTPPSVDRTNKPTTLQNMPTPDDQLGTAGGYEPVGKPPTSSKKKDYEDVVFKEEPKPIKDVYAKVDLESKAKEKEAKALREKEQKQKKQQEKEEKERKEREEKERKQKEKIQKQKEEKERKEREKAEKEEKKLREKREKEQREKEEKERKQREKENKEKEKREKAMKVEKEKHEKEQREKEEKERKQHEKDELDKAERE